MKLQITPNVQLCKGGRYEPKQQPQQKTPRKNGLPSDGSSTLHLRCAKNDKKCNCECNPFNQTSSAWKDGCNTYQFGRMHSALVLGSTGLVVEHANVLKCGPLLGQRFHAASKVLVDARELAKAKQNMAKQMNSVVNPQGSIQKSFKGALTSQGKSFRSAVHATTRRVHSKEESWLETIKCQMPNFHAYRKHLNETSIQMRWQKFRLSTLIENVSGMPHPPVQESSKPNSN